MRVLKFGGTSLANSTRFLQVASIIENTFLKEQVAVVLSAPAKVTNLLVAVIENAKKGKNTTDYFVELETIFNNIIVGLSEANSAFNGEKVQNLVDKEIEQLNQFINQILETQDCDDQLIATIYCLGERISIEIMQGWFEAKGKSVSNINPVENLIAEGDYLESSVDLVKSKKRFKQLEIPENNLILMAGFTAGNKLGELVLLGRNGSDYSAACLSACLNADYCEIWTDVDGIYTCDPRIVPDAICLEAMSYQEAMELSYFGAKVIHPRTISPLIADKIPCVIKNTANPVARGTIINDHINIDSMVKGITNLDDITMFNISGSGMQGIVGMAARIFSTMSKANISIILITQSSSEYSISFCVRAKESQKAIEVLNKEFQQELEQQLLDPIELIQDLSIISVVGDGMKQSKGIAARFFFALAQVNISIIAIAQGSSERSISAVVPKNKAVEAVKSIHQVLFSNKKVINLCLVGIGGVGSCLIEQIKNQKDYLLKKDIEIKVCYLANSKKSISNKDGIDLSDWKIQLEQTSKPFDFESLVAFVKQYHLVNPVFVDCTTSQDIANLYTRALKEGFHIVTPNKKANTSDYNYYQQIRENARLNHHKFLYETNVGAGLPVIENLQNLLAAGDEVECFEGILSGSLSFIFGLLEEGLTLSQATLLAKQKGFTEPDPRDDLSGEDVARKLLILAREMGLSLELSDVEIEGVLPKDFAKNKSTEEFLTLLPELDQEFAKNIEKATACNKVLRYVGSISNGKCKVFIKEVESNDPLYKVKNGENALAFYTHYYSPIPLLLRGYGAGNDVTAAGIFADILRTLK